MQNYEEKEEAYFGHAREEIAPLLPKVCERVLEIGCGAGATLAWLKEKKFATRTVGVEIAEGAAVVAKRNADEVHCIDFEHAKLPNPTEKFDLILCLDVLEHMVEPWQAVDRLVSHHLEEHGTVIISLPNVQHYSVVLPLLFRGKWDYQQAGLLDRTHLRFFTRETAIKLLSHPQLQPANLLGSDIEWQTRKGLFNRLTFGIFRSLLTYQYILSACKKK
jgi:2-polyprenyl-3-methyl-5-hydroxy-6-metoxy-1,4-benzoquinol methylase